jgi:membrane protease YdiL (CAAX protease family)
MRFPSARDNRDLVAVCLTAAVVLTLTEYLTVAPQLAQTPFKVIHARLLTVGGPALEIYWAIGTTVLLGLIPAVVAAALRWRPSECGWRLRLADKGYIWAALLYALMLPVVFFASRQPAFSSTYPIYRGWQTDLSGLIWFEIAYAIQYVAHEFFFRGFLVLGLGRVLGHNAVHLALIPYVMIHYHKPMPEALGAIVAGVVLGEIAWRTKSIIPGLVLHLAVGLTMDFFAISAAQ